MSTRTQAVLVTASGIASGVAILATGGATTHDIGVVVGMAAAGALIAVAVAGAIHRLSTSASLRRRLVVGALAAIGATVTGAALAARAMFLSAHDLRVLLAVLAVAGSVAVASALRLAAQVSADAASVAIQAHRLLEDPGIEPDGSYTAEEPVRPTVTELAALHDDLTTVADRLAAARRRERLLDASRRELVAWVSHDLRSPVASIRAMAEALEDGIVEDRADVDRYHEAIRREAVRLGLLVDDLFELSRISSGSRPADQELTPFTELVDEVLAAVQPAAHQKGVTVDSRLVLDRNPQVPSSDLRRVLRNLLDNAVAHTIPGGAVSIDGRIDGDHLVVSVSDGCGGIPAHDLPRVFEVAFRGDVARQRDSGGGGLGLAIAKGLVEAQSGDLGVVNDGAGCRFTLHLPIGRP